MHDIRAIREAPDAFDRAMARRGLEPQSEAILKLDVARREAQTELQQLQSRRNEASKEIGQIKKQGGDAQALIDEVSAIKERMATLEGEEKIAADALRVLLGGLPNVPDAAVPDGADESDNVEMRRNGDPSRSNSAQEHNSVGEALGLMDFATAAKMSGSRFVLLRGALARLERAIGQFMIDLHATEHGYTEVSPPLMVRDEAMFGTGQLPKFAEESFRTTNDLWLIPTSEVSMTNIVAGEIVASEDLPYRFTAITPCFRAEAGAAGKDTRGMIRQHQFYKVELVSVTEPDKSEEELERMTQCAEAVLQKLGLAYRVMTLSTGDLGFAAHKTYDIEVWLPGQNAYREISSCSNTGDFQARRMNARCRAHGEKETRFVHTLNGSGVAVGRALIAILENYQQPDGSIAVPEVLQPYMGGQTVIAAE